MTSKLWNKIKRVIFLFSFFSSSVPCVLRSDLWKIIILCWGLLPCYGRMKFIFAFYWHHLFLFWQVSKTASYGGIIHTNGLVLRYSGCSDDHQMLKNSFFPYSSFFYVVWQNITRTPHPKSCKIPFLLRGTANSYPLEIMKNLDTVFGKSFTRFFSHSPF